MELTKYSWWGESNEPPPHLKTKKQLGELGLSPLKPSGVIETRKYDVLLYDSTNPECCRPKRKPTPKQLETLAANRLKAKIKRDYRESTTYTDIRYSVGLQETVSLVDQL